MPLYEFRCEKCSKITERLCPIGTNGKGLKCPSCGGGRMRRIMSIFAARSKGEGGATKSVGSSCAGCSSGNCATCH